jgi:hypothetical protein
MKRIIAVFLILTTLLVAQGRLMIGWSYQELYDRSDLVVIAKPTLIQVTAETATLPDIRPDTHVIGLSTEFAISLVVKGDKSVKKLTLHHYRLADPEQGTKNGPHLAAFDPKQHTRFLLFLHREADGRYSPVSGQTDPALSSVVKLEGIAE